ncbi:hypothetical protein IE81DRAFT_120757 [Ceraceosorus guamensis]|uniref:Uncharacterized protein n=1 Tax=Ceraceosorus guamensis TaxID=1522189 RepID=A0A316W4L2_9BASI|nr:hypothetical protein IE81DRAFT_120757 [Ceraceosorus guamensis]PWN42545.1 hypothetical protein IE81DRAFT_120757 [Ceraceosorus guamensis]
MQKATPASRRPSHHPPLVYACDCLSLTPFTRPPSLPPPASRSQSALQSCHILIGYVLCTALIPSPSL